MTTRHWYLIHTPKYERGVWTCAPPKAGSTALREATGHAWKNRRFPEQIPEDGLYRFLALRDPVDRFYSLWRDKIRDQGAGVPKELYGVNPDVLMDYIEEHPEDNHHWRRQADFVAPLTVLVPFDKLLDVVGLPLPENRNQNKKKLTDPSMPKKRIQKFYESDYELIQRTGTGSRWWPTRFKGPRDHWTNFI